MSGLRLQLVGTTGSEIVGLESLLAWHRLSIPVGYVISECAGLLTPIPDAGGAEDDMD